MLESLDAAKELIVHGSQIILEMIGLGIIVAASIQSLMHYMSGIEHVRLEFAKKICLALEFLMAGEILHTIIAEEYHELVVLGAIIIFRAVLTFEISHEEKELEEKLEKRKADQ